MFLCVIHSSAKTSASAKSSCSNFECKNALHALHIMVHTLPSCNVLSPVSRSYNAEAEFMTSRNFAENIDLPRCGVTVACLSSPEHFRSLDRVPLPDTEETRAVT